MRRADLWATNLSSAKLIGANLSYANLVGSDLSGAYLKGANLEGVLFEPNPRSLPNIEAAAEAANLSKLSYRSSPRALVELRNAFKEAGFRYQEREITYAIKSRELKYRGIAAIPNFVLFELTTDWGMSPHRELNIIIVLIAFFAVPYIFSLRFSHTDGIWRNWADKRVRLDLGNDEPERIHLNWWRAICVGFYFSILSAFNIGWREINVGNWISRIQPREYSLRASGWVRSVAGIQSLISVYLLAIWVLTYFSRPFE